MPLICGENTLIRNRKKTEEEITAPSHRIKVWHIFNCALMLLALLAMISHSPRDWNILNEGVNMPLENWIGLLGARFSLFMLFTFGIAGYILVVLFLLRSFRVLFPGAGVCAAAAGSDEAGWSPVYAGYQAGGAERQ